ncbi:MAG: GNAT family N-acetyltransferase [Chloroflexi bacterium]|nr:MAG: GNAT family N-acetyltransferase [Chloroflexota bacterium]
MPHIIRPAVAQDISAIVTLSEQVWDTPFSQETIATALAQDGHRAHVIDTLDGIMGYISSFLTYSSQGVERWEVDLLAIHPNYRNKGAGRALVHATTAAGRAISANIARALVRVSNTPMHHVMAACDYVRSEETYALYVTQPHHHDNYALTCDETWLLPVKTFSYAGIWLEGAITLNAINTAHKLAAEKQADTLGAVIPLSHVHDCRLLESQGFEMIGEFHWWQRAL